MVIEVKVVVMVFKWAPDDVSPFAIVVCRPQVSNETESFTNDVCDAVCEAEKTIDSCTFDCFSTDGLPLESLDIVASSAHFWRGIKNYNSGTDAKHNVKNDLYYELGGNSVIAAGDYLMDGNLFRKAGAVK